MQRVKHTRYIANSILIGCPATSKSALLRLLAKRLLSSRVPYQSPVAKPYRRTLKGAHF